MVKKQELFCHLIGYPLLNYCGAVCVAVEAILISRKSSKPHKNTVQCKSRISYIV